MTSPSKDMVGIPSVGGGCMPDNLGESIVLQPWGVYCLFHGNSIVLMIRLQWVTRAVFTVESRHHLECGF